MHRSKNGHTSLEPCEFLNFSTSRSTLDLAGRQMPGFGGIVTFFIKGDLEDARRFLERCRVFSLAESLGGVESLVDHPAIMTHASVPESHRDFLGISDKLVRLSVGIEAIDDLIADLDPLGRIDAHHGMRDISIGDSSAPGQWPIRHSLP